MGKYENAWLAYCRTEAQEDAVYFHSVYSDGDDRLLRTAQGELRRAAEELFGLSMEKASEKKHAGIILELNACAKTGTEGYHIREKNGSVTIVSKGTAGLLYGVFACIRLVRTGVGLKDADLLECPSNPLRMLNHWDNADGTIERGYAGNSFFFRNGELLLNDRTEPMFWQMPRRLTAVSLSGDALYIIVSRTGGNGKRTVRGADMTVLCRWTENSGTT